jgi:hypothetical protein
MRYRLSTEVLEANTATFMLPLPTGDKERKCSGSSAACYEAVKKLDNGRFYQCPVYGVQVF